MAEEGELKKGDKIPLAAGQRFHYRNEQTLEIKAIAGSTIHVAYYTNATGITRSFTFDLARMPLLIGNLSMMDENYDRKFHELPPLLPGDTPSPGIIKLEEGRIVYEHRGRVDIKYSLPPEILKKPAESALPDEGNGGVCSVRNEGPENHRTSNEDRAAACIAPASDDKEAQKFLRDTVRKIIDDTRDIISGSTLSMAMRTTDGHFACAHIGDSPLFLIARNKDTQEIKLIQIGIPHSRVGEMMQYILKQRAKKGEACPTTQNFEAFSNFVEKSDPSIAKWARGDHGPWITRLLGMKVPQKDYPPAPIPDVYIVDPEIECPGLECLGMMVCSDGINPGVKSADPNVKSAVVQKLQSLPENDLSSPEEIAETAVSAACPLSTDNVTAAVLFSSAKAGDLIAVADGMEGSAEASEKAITSLKQICRGTRTPNTDVTPSSTPRPVADHGQIPWD